MLLRCTSSTAAVVVATQAAVAAAAAAAPNYEYIFPAVFFCVVAHLVERRGRETERGRGDESARHPERSNSGNGGDLHISGCDSMLLSRQEEVTSTDVSRRSQRLLERTHEIGKQEQTTSKKKGGSVHQHEHFHYVEFGPKMGEIQT